MQSRFFSDRDELSIEIAKFLISIIPENTRVNVLLSAGTLPMQIYDYLAPRLKNHQYSGIHYYLADEIPISAGDISMLTYAKIRDAFFIPAQIPTERIHALDANNIRGMDEEIARAGGIDVALLSLESDGHIAGNLPGSSFDSESREVLVDKHNTDIVNALQDRIGDDLVVPDSLFTVGMRTIKQSKRIVLVAVGDKKINAMLYLMRAPLSESLPASILHLHNNCYLMIDSAAARGVQG